MRAAEHRLHIHRILNNLLIKTRGRKLNLWNYILTAEIQAGTQFLVTKPEGALYVVLGITNEIISIPRAGRGGDRWFSYFHTTYGISEREDEAKFVYDILRAYIYEHGIKVSLRRFSSYNLVTRTVYMSAYNGRMYKIDGTNITELSVGEDEIFFADDDGGEHVDVDIGDHGLLVERITNLNFAASGLSGITPEQQKMALTIWMFALAFPDLMPTKVLLLLEGAQGSGKCLGAGTRVILANGDTIPVELVKTGDQLIGPDGKPRNVLSTIVGNGPLYRINPVKGDPWICNDAHILTLKNSDTDNIEDIPLSTFLDMKPWRQNRWKQFNVGVDDFAISEPRPIDPYFLGLWFGDGTKSLNENGILTGVAISKPDPEVLAICKNIANIWDLKVTTTLSYNNCPTHRLISTAWHSNKLLDAIRNIVGPSINIPKAYACAPRNERLAFLAGFLDADAEYNQGFIITQKREDWAKAIWWIARSLGFFSTIRTRQAGYKRQDGTEFIGTYWVVGINGNLDQIPTKIPRKQAKARQQIKDATRTGLTVEPIGSGNYYGFTLDGDGRFLLGDFTVTHNTTGIQLLQLTLMGMSRPMILQRNKEDDFGVVLLRSPIALFDNTDSYIDWVPDAVCAYTTSGSWTKRRLYSDDESMVIKPHAFIAIASKNPASFRREDVADRCIILRLERRAEFTALQQLQAEFAVLRPKLMGEYLYLVSRIVEELRLTAERDEPMIAEVHRMADFAQLGRAVGRVLGWTAKSLADLMRAIQSEQAAFTNEEDPLIDLLQKWIAYPARSGVRNIGRSMTGLQLHTELENLAQALAISWKHSPRTLAQKIRSPHIEREFHIETEIIGGHRAYKIWRHSDARLKIVDELIEIIDES